MWFKNCLRFQTFKIVLWNGSDRSYGCHKSDLMTIFRYVFFRSYNSVVKPSSEQYIPIKIFLLFCTLPVEWIDDSSKASSKWTYNIGSAVKSDVYYRYITKHYFDNKETKGSTDLDGRLSTLALKLTCQGVSCFILVLT